MSAPIRLPGQAAAPEGPADMTMMYVLHHAFRRDLRDFRSTVATANADDHDRWRLLRERWGLFVDELHQHHTKEDEILWPLLLERAGNALDAEAVRVLEEMEEEHAVLDPLLRRCTEGFDALATSGGVGVGAGDGAGDEDARTRLRHDLDALASVLDQHLGHEEAAAVAVLQRYVGGEEWDRIEREKFRGKPKLAHARVFLPWIFKELPPDAARHVLQLGDPAMKVLLALSRRRFDARERRVFGTA